MAKAQQAEAVKQRFYDGTIKLDLTGLDSRVEGDFGKEILVLQRVPMVEVDHMMVRELVENHMSPASPMYGATIERIHEVISDASITAFLSERVVRRA